MLKIFIDNFILQYLPFLLTTQGEESPVLSLKEHYSRKRNTTVQVTDTSIGRKLTVLEFKTIRVAVDCIMKHTTIKFKKICASVVEL